MAEENPRDVTAAEPREEQEEMNGDGHSSRGDDRSDDRGDEERDGPMAIELGQHEKLKAELGNDDKYEITEEDCMDELGFSYPEWKKWYILTVIFIVQVRPPSPIPPRTILH